MSDLIFTIFIISTKFISCSIALIDYCKLPCDTAEGPVEHIMCSLRHDCSRGPECKVNTSISLDTKTKIKILDAHNYYRNQIASGGTKGSNGLYFPTASNMQELVWDNELAYMAQCYADQCVLKNDQCRKNSAQERVGQNIYIRMSMNEKSADEILMEMLQAAHESSQMISDFDEIISYKPNRATQQFVQLIWAKTTRVGCGVTKLLENLYAYFMVCNYAIEGGAKFESVYDFGYPCSNCLGGRSCSRTWTGLCEPLTLETSSIDEGFRSLPIMGNIEYLKSVKKATSTEKTTTPQITTPLLIKIFENSTPTEEKTINVTDKAHSPLLKQKFNAKLMKTDQDFFFISTPTSNSTEENYIEISTRKIKICFPRKIESSHTKNVPKKNGQQSNIYKNSILLYLSLKLILIQ